MSTLFTATAEAGLIPVPNGNFEADILADGGYTIFTATSWVPFGGVGYGAGVFNPTTAQYAGEAPEGQNVGWMVTYNSAGLLQTLSATYQAGYTYMLTALVGDRDDYAIASFRLGLFAGGISLAENGAPLPPEGGFTLVTTTFDADSTVDGVPIEIRLSAYPGVDVDPDQDPSATGTVVDFDDVQLESSVTVTSVVPRPSGQRGFALHPPVPNPFNPGTSVAFELPEQSPASLRVYDASGRLVRRLIDRQVIPGGRHVVEWNGRNDRGEPVATGVYFCRLEAGAFTETVRMVLVK